MQPRREYEREPGRAVFQVTKSGYSASGSIAGREWVLISGVVAVVLGSREEDEEEEGVDRPLDDRPPSLARVGFRSEPLILDGEETSVASSSSSSCRLFWYVAHEVSTSGRVIGVRCPSAAPRASKQ